MIKVILFDADGVIVNGERFSVALARDYGISIEKTLPFFNGPFQECVVGNADLKEMISPYLDTWDWNKGVEAFLEYWFTAEHKLNEELINYIQVLRSKGVLCFLATNNEKYRFEYMLEHMGFSNCFDKTYASSHLGAKKPDHDFFVKILHELDGIKKEEIFFVDDDIDNIESAKEFGIHAEIYTTFENFKKKLYECNS